MRCRKGIGMLASVAMTVMTVLPTAAEAQEDLRMEPNTLNFGSEADTATVKVEGETDYELFWKSDWMECSEKEDCSLEIRVEPYDRFYPRRACVTVTSRATNYSRVLEVRQVGDNGRPAAMAAPEGSNLLMLSDMDLSKAKPYYIREVHKNKSVDGNQLSLKATKYENGIGTHAPTALVFKVNGAKRFRADVAIDDEVLLSENPRYGNATFRILVDGKEIERGALRLFDNDVVAMDVDLEGAEYLTLEFGSNGSANGDHISLGNACFEVEGEAPRAVSEEERDAAIGAVGK